MTLQWLNRWANRRRLHWLILAIVSVVAIVGTWRIASLALAARQPIDAWFILGGSIKREMYVASRANEPGAGIVDGKPLPIAISSGSKLPCLWAIFQREGVSPDRVWIEECARSTFENFVYGVPLFVEWKTRHVKMTTSESHYPRAKWMAQVAFGMRGIWVEFDPAPEIGVPGNRESPLKTVLDETRMLAWSIVAPLMPVPVRCDRVVNLAAIDWSAWRDRTFECEYQGQVRPEELPAGVQGLRANAYS